MTAAPLPSEGTPTRCSNCGKDEREHYREGGVLYCWSRREFPTMESLATGRYLEKFTEPFASLPPVPQRGAPEAADGLDTFSIDLAEFACAVRDTVRSLNGPARDAALAWEDEARERLRESHAALLARVAQLTAERDEFRDGLASMTLMYGAERERADRAEQGAARLDWLERHAQSVDVFDPPSGDAWVWTLRYVLPGDVDDGDTRVTTGHVTISAAIDAARTPSPTTTESTDG